MKIIKNTVIVLIGVFCIVATIFLITKSDFAFIGKYLSSHIGEFLKLSGIFLTVLFAMLS